MVRALQVVWSAAKDLFDEFFLLIVVNMLWSLLSLPLLALSTTFLSNGLLLESLIVAIVAIIPLAPASVALCAVAAQVSEGVVVSWRFFFTALRRYAIASWKILGLWYLGLLIIIVDIWFYSGFANLFGVALTVFWLYMLAFWMVIVLYLPPLLVLREGQSLWANARLVIGLALGFPLFSLTLALISALLLVVTLFVPPILMLIGAALLALVGVRATRKLLDLLAERIEQQEAQLPSSAERGRRGQVRPRE